MAHTTQSLARQKLLLADFQMLIASMSFGFGFLGQRAAMLNGLRPLICNSSRFFLSTLLLIIMIPFLPSSLKERKGIHSPENSKSNCNISSKSDKNISVNHSYFGEFITKENSASLFWGLILGVLNFGGSSLQTWGMTLTTASKSAFITGFYVFFVPILTLCIPVSMLTSTSTSTSITLPGSPLRTKRPPRMQTLVAVSLSLLGLFLLSGASWSSMSLGPGETLTLLGTVFWTLHLIATDIATNFVDSISMTLYQFVTVTVLSTVSSLAVEPSQWGNNLILSNWFWILLLALTEGTGFLLAAIAQRFSPPAHAAVIFSLEAVFASLAGFLFLHEVLTFRELGGCVLMIVSTVIGQLDQEVDSDDGDNVLLTINPVSTMIANTYETAALLAAGDALYRD